MSTDGFPTTTPAEYGVVRVKLTRAFWVPVVAGALLFLLAQLTGEQGLVLATAALFGIPLAAVILPPRVVGYRLEGELPPRTSVGEVVPYRVRMSNPTKRSSPPMRWTDDTAGLSPVVVAVPPLGPGETAETTLQRTALRRGVVEAVQVELSSSAPFGLIRSTGRWQFADRMIIHPRTVPAPRMVPLPGERRRQAPRGLPGQGEEILGLRQWRPGDDPRGLHARASARRGSPVLLEREADDGTPLVLVVAGAAADEEWEHAVARAAALARDALRESRPVALVRPGSVLALPAGAPVVRVLDWFAEVGDVPVLAAEDVQAALSAAGPRGSVVAVCPPALLAARLLGLRRAADRGRQTVVVLVGDALQVHRG